MRLKKFFVSFLSAAVLLSFVSVSATADSNGWQGDYDSGWKYYTTFGGYVKNDWKSIDGKWYYFNSDGYMESNCYRDGYWLDKTGAWNPNYSHGTWKKNSVGWWYADNGWYPVSQWLWIDGECYYFDSEGYMESECYRDGCWLKKNGILSTVTEHGRAILQDAGMRITDGIRRTVSLLLMADVIVLIMMDLLRIIICWKG